MNRKIQHIQVHKVKCVVEHGVSVEEGPRPVR